MIQFLIWLCNKKLNPIETELFIGDRKLNISPVFITKSYLKVSKDVRLNITTHYILKKIPNKRELQQIAINHSSDIDLKILRRFIKNTI